MKSRGYFGVLAVVVIAMSFSDSVEAQAIGGRGASRRVPHYNRTQTISPYAQLFGRNNGGGVTNYFLEVRPRLQMQQQLNQMQANNFRQAQQNQQQFLRQNQEMRQVLLANQENALLTVRGAQAGRVSNSASFFNTRGYFQRFGGMQAGQQNRAALR